MNIINFFSGLGYFEVALDRLNIDYNIKLFSETDKYKKHLYQTLHGKQTHVDDILDYKAKSYPPHDMLVYSTVFLNMAGLEREHTLRFEGRDDSYFWHMMDIVNKRRPKYIVGDNSYWLSTNATHDLKVYEDYMDSIGYDTHYQLMNAYDYGVPQLKRRTMIICIRQDLEQDFEFPNPKLEPNLFRYLETDVSSKMYNTATKRSVKTDYPMIVYRHKERFIVTRQRKYASSLGYTYAKGLDSTRNRTYIADNKGTRRLSPREFARLYGFTDDEFDIIENELRHEFYYGYDATDTRMYKIFGSGVVINPLVYIFDELLGHLRSENQ